MDEGLSKTVTEIFVRMYHEGLVYRGKRLVNWDPKLGTAVSDLEVESEAEDHLVAAVLRNAEQGCFARAAIEQPVAVTSTAKVNGRSVDFESYPRRVPRRQS